MNDSRVACALRIEEATKVYGEVVALDGLSLTVEGGIFGLLGGNGAGKSTVLKAVLGMVALDQGRIRVDGLDSRQETIEVRRRVGYLPERLDLDDRLSGWEHLTFVAGIKGLDNRDERLELVEEIGLEEHCHRLLGGMSLGMRKKVGLIGALMGSPHLILLDEPLGGLDTESMAWLRQRIEAMAAAGTTFVISSHVMSFVERICTRVAILSRGRLVAEGTPRGLASSSGLAGATFEDVFLHFVRDGSRGRG